MALYTVEELIEWAKKALPDDDFSKAMWEYRGEGLYYISNIKDNMGNEHTVEVCNRDRDGDPPEICDADTGERYWPDVKK
jgi:hypothetical protein